jgi:hypothetical protein
MEVGLLLNFAPVPRVKRLPSRMKGSKACVVPGQAAANIVFSVIAKPNSLCQAWVWLLLTLALVPSRLTAQAKPIQFTDVTAYLYHNAHNGTFTEVGLPAGMAVAGQGLIMAAMCLSLGDHDNDGWLDLYISDFQKSSDQLWHNSGKGYFDEVSGPAGITVPTREVVSFGGGFFDYDNDGWLDLFIANGHVYPEVTPEIHYRQLNTLFHNEGNGKFVEVTKQAGSGLEKPHVGRGVAFADFDNHGFRDLVVGNNGDPPLLLHNSGGNGNHFLNFKLVGVKSNRDAMGARVRVAAGGMSQMREIAGGGSYLSQSDLRANFGIGKATRAQTVEVQWPSGQHQVFRDVEAGKFYVAGFRPRNDITNRARIVFPHE